MIRTWQTDALAGGDAVPVVAAAGARRQAHVAALLVLSITVQATTAVWQVAVPVDAFPLTNRHTDFAIRV
jgi:hypothetical protein